MNIVSFGEVNTYNYRNLTMLLHVIGDNYLKAIKRSSTLKFCSIEMNRGQSCNIE